MNDVRVILKAFHSFSSFTEAKDNLELMALLTLGLTARVKRVKPLEVLCSIGEVPSEVFYIFEGKIAVTSIPRANVSWENLSTYDCQFESRGSVLGEASVLYASRRTATLLAYEESILLVLNKETFLKTLGSHLKKWAINRLEIMKKLPIFDMWNMAQLGSIYKQAEKRDFHFGQTIYHHGDVEFNLYIVLKGEVDLFHASYKTQMDGHYLPSHRCSLKQVTMVVDDHKDQEDRRRQLFWQRRRLRLPHKEVHYQSELHYLLSLGAG